MTFLLSPKKERILPVVPLREGVLFPHVETILSFGRPSSIAAVEAAFRSDRLVCFLTQKGQEIEGTNEIKLYQIGTLGKIERLLRTENELNAWVKGIGRVQLESLEATTPFMVGKFIELPEISEVSDETTALANNLVKNFQEAVSLGKVVDVMMVMKLLGENTPTEIADQISYILDIETAEKQNLLETLSVKERLLKATDYLAHELKVLELERMIDSKTRRKFDRSMKESILRERKRVIEEELGEVAEEEDEIKELKQKIKKVKMPLEVEKKAEKELKRLSNMNPNHPEFSYIRTYLDWLTEMPWSVSTPNQVSISQAAKILNEDHWGLEKVKERVIEYLAVMKLREKKKKEMKKEKSKEGGPTILCFVGPPGVGKTSIGKSIARALGRKFFRVSLGGIRDEAEIRGHRRTYVGALPGRIIQGIRNAGTNNPVFMLDEIDKIGADFRGDPSAALLEALDPEQNHEFSDHYLEVPFDLSRVMFITTANILDTIPPALRDRMEVIPFPGYTEVEKFHIAQKYLWNKQLVSNGLKENEIKIADEAIYEIIRRYTREAGVRELERCLATICRKLAKKVAESKKISKIIKRTDISKYLGPRKYTETLAEKKDEIGIATGLAYTEAGGDILFTEVALMPGKGNLLLTGKLGEVMKESGKAALSYVRSRWEQLGLKRDFYKNLDIHIHVPEGAVPKDGPSAGVAITVALVSALTKTPTRMDTGMTGEITLRGRVLEIGGVKEKVIAAHRAGLKRVILPKDNKKDLVDVPASVKKDIEFLFVSHLDDVLKLALKRKNGRN